MTDTGKLDRIAKALCNSGVFENGQGVCAARCMDQLGVVRPNCRHSHEIFRKHAEAVLQVGTKKKRRPYPPVIRQCGHCGGWHAPNSCPMLGAI